jgi:hypothetical protein
MLLRCSVATGALGDGPFAQSRFCEVNDIRPSMVRGGREPLESIAL